MRTIADLVREIGRASTSGNRMVNRDPPTRVRRAAWVTVALPASGFFFGSGKEQEFRRSSFHRSPKRGHGGSHAVRYRNPPRLITRRFGILEVLLARKSPGGDAGSAQGHLAAAPPMCCDLDQRLGNLFIRLPSPAGSRAPAATGIFYLGVRRLWAGSAWKGGLLLGALPEFRR